MYENYAFASGYKKQVCAPVLISAGKALFFTGFNKFTQFLGTMDLHHYQYTFVRFFFQKQVVLF